MNSARPSLQWKMTLLPTTGRLLIEYKVSNPTSGRMYIADKMVIAKRNNKFGRSEGIIVRNAGSPGQPSPGMVDFVLGSISPDVPAAMIYEPTYRMLEAGQTCDRAIETAYPLRAWHSSGRMNPITANPRMAVLYIDAFSGEPAQWNTLLSDDAEPLKVPANFSRMTIQGEQQPLPVAK